MQRFDVMSMASGVGRAAHRERSARLQAGGAKFGRERRRARKRPCLGRRGHSRAFRRLAAPVATATPVVPSPKTAQTAMRC
jgi:hypothetical protein